MTTSTYATYDTVTVRRVVFPRALSHQPDPVYRMFIAPADQPSKGIRIPYAPVEVNHTRGADYADVSRVGRKPALVYMNAKRREQSFTLLVADKWQAVAGSPTAPTRIYSANTIAGTLSGWAEGGVRLRVTYGWFENGVWRITDFSIRSTKREVGNSNNNFTVAEISITLTEVQDVKVGVGPVSGGVKPAPSKTTPAPKTRTYIVKKGDTLWGISIKYYGTGTKWRKIADANKLKNANNIFPGQKLKIP